MFLSCATIFGVRSFNNPLINVCPVNSSERDGFEVVHYNLPFSNLSNLQELCNFITLRWLNSWRVFNKKMSNFVGLRLQRSSAGVSWCFSIFFWLRIFLLKRRSSFGCFCKWEIINFIMYRNWNFNNILLKGDWKDLRTHWRVDEFSACVRACVCELVLFLHGRMDAVCCWMNEILRSFVKRSSVLRFERIP